MANLHKLMLGLAGMAIALVLMGGEMKAREDPPPLSGLPASSFEKAAKNLLLNAPSRP